MRWRGTLSNNSFILYGYLVRVHETTHAILDRQDIVVDTIDVTTRHLELIRHQPRRVETAKVESSRGLVFGDIETEWVKEVDRIMM